MPERDEDFNPDEDFLPDELEFDIPEDFEPDNDKAEKPKPTARKRLLPRSSEQQTVRAFYGHLIVILVILQMLIAWVAYSRASRIRAEGAWRENQAKIETLNEQYANIAPKTPETTDKYREQLQSLWAQRTALELKLNSRIRLPRLFYAIMGIVIAGVLYSALKTLPQVGRSLPKFYKAGICLVATLLTSMAYLAAFFLHYVTGGLWFFSIAFVLLLITIILIVSPNMYKVFTGSRGEEQKDEDIETLEELQDRLPFGDLDS